MSAFFESGMLGDMIVFFEKNSTYQLLSLVGVDSKSFPSSPSNSWKPKCLPQKIGFSVKVQVSRLDTDLIPARDYFPQPAVAMRNLSL